MADLALFLGSATLIGLPVAVIVLAIAKLGGPWIGLGIMRGAILIVGHTVVVVVQVAMVAHLVLVSVGLVRVEHSWAVIVGIGDAIVVIVEAGSARAVVAIALTLPQATNPVPAVRANGKLR